jgi:membrane-bound ClpP family serine protease
VFGACRPLRIGEDGPEPIGGEAEKLILTQVRTCAERNGYPVSVAESLVTENRSLTATEARDEGFCGPLVEGREEALSRFGLTPGEVVVPSD